MEGVESRAQAVQAALVTPPLRVKRLTIFKGGSRLLDRGRRLVTSSSGRLAEGQKRQRRTVMRPKDVVAGRDGLDACAQTVEIGAPPTTRARVEQL